MTGLENLKIYQMAKDLELKIHKIVKSFPTEEKFRSADQLNRSSSSITNNIAEAYYKSSPKQKIHIIRNIVITELEETRSNILRCANKDFLSEAVANELANDYVELRKAIFGYIKFLRNSSTHQLINSSTDKGQLLIESMIGISIAVVGLLGILTLLSRSISLNRVVSDQFTGAYLAAEGIEIVKNLIDSNIIQGGPGNWNNKLSTNGDYEADYTTTFENTAAFPLSLYTERKLKFDEASGFYNYTTGRETAFIRKIKIKNIDEGNDGAEQIVVNSIVSWTTRGGGQFDVNLEDHFFNWRP